jgi:hypothetical protein
MLQLLTAAANGQGRAELCGLLLYNYKNTRNISDDE